MERIWPSEIAAELKISIDAVRKRIETAEIEPISREFTYDKRVVDILRKVKMGRPKTKPEKPAKAKKTKKPK